MTDFLGIDADVWNIVLAAIVVIETFVLIVLATKQRKTDTGQSPILLEDPEKIYSTEKRSSNLDLFIKLGDIEFSLGNLPKALIYYGEALERARSIGDSVMSGVCLNNIGLTYETKGDLDTALKYFQDALKIYKNIGCKEGVAEASNNIRRIYKTKGRAYRRRS